MEAVSDLGLLPSESLILDRLPSSSSQAGACVEDGGEGLMGLVGTATFWELYLPRNFLELIS